MKDKKVIQDYINNFRRHMARFLRKDFGLTTTVYPCSGDGGVIEFRIGRDSPNEDEFKKPYQSVNEVLKSIPQKIVSGNIDSAWFAGTNISMEPGRILIIKGEDRDALWNETEAFEDVKKIVDSAKKESKK